MLGLAWRRARLTRRQGGKILFPSGPFNSWSLDGPSAPNPFHVQPQVVGSSCADVMGHPQHIPQIRV